VNRIAYMRWGALAVLACAVGTCDDTLAFHKNTEGAGIDCPAGGLVFFVGFVCGISSNRAG